MLLKREGGGAETGGVNAGFLISTLLPIYWSPYSSLANNIYNEHTIQGIQSS